jgi:hypothetical protein
LGNEACSQQSIADHQTVDKNKDGSNKDKDGSGKNKDGSNKDKDGSGKIKVTFMKYFGLFSASIRIIFVLKGLTHAKTSFTSKIFLQRKF